jgi:hypothetical protein
VCSKARFDDDANGVEQKIFIARSPHGTAPGQADRGLALPGAGLRKHPAMPMAAGEMAAGR